MCPLDSVTDCDALIYIFLNLYHYVVYLYTITGYTYIPLLGIPIYPYIVLVYTLNTYTYIQIYSICIFYNFCHKIIPAVKTGITNQLFNLSKPKQIPQAIPNITIPINITIIVLLLHLQIFLVLTSTF
jgi:hypothetical protein